MNNTEDKTSDPLYSGLDSKTADQGFKETGDPFYLANRARAMLKKSQLRAKEQ